MNARSRSAGAALLAIATALLAYGSARVLAPVAKVLAMSALAAAVSRPFHSRLLAKRPLNPNSAAAAVALLVCAALALPLTLGCWYLVRESVHAYPLLREWFASSRGALRPPSWLPSQALEVLDRLDAGEFLLDNFREIGAGSGRLLGSAARIAWDALAFAAGLFLCLRDGPRAIARLQALLPLDRESSSRIIRRANDMVIATIEGVFAVALVQGLLSALGLALIGVRFPLLLGSLCMLFSPVPVVGPALVWVPIAAGMALRGEGWRAAVVVLWFSAVVGTIDNLARPLIVAGRSRLPAPLVLLGVLGGIQAFGALGTFLGPVILSLAAAVLDALMERAGDETDA